MTWKAGHKLAQGKYVLVRQLGQGGQAEVWEARQSGPGDFTKKVVLKLITHPGDGDKALRMILHEARVIARLHHRHIVEIYELGQEQDLAYIAMEYIPGHDLEVLLSLFLQKHKQPFPWPMVARLILDVCLGLHHAHTQVDENGIPLGLIHRDLKPGNLLLRQDGFIKIIDFGIAKSDIFAQLTATGALKGTPHYMAPEQIQKKTLSPATDLFALGAILYRLSTGKLPFWGHDIYAVLYAILEDTPPSPRSLQPDIPVALDTLILRLLAKDPAIRPRDVEEVHSVLKTLLREHHLSIDHDEIARFYQHALHGTHTPPHPAVLWTFLPATNPTPPRNVLADKLPSLQSLDATETTSPLASQTNPAKHPPVLWSQDTDTTPSLAAPEMEPANQQQKTDPWTESNPIFVHHTSVQDPPQRSHLWWLLVVGPFSVLFGVLLWWQFFPSSTFSPTLHEPTPRESAFDATSSAEEMAPHFSPTLPDLSVQEIFPLGKKHTQTPPIKRPRRHRPKFRREVSPPRREKSLENPLQLTSEPRLKPSKSPSLFVVHVDVQPPCMLIDESETIALPAFANTVSSIHRLRLQVGQYHLRCYNKIARLNHYITFSVGPHHNHQIMRRFAKGTLKITSYPRSIVYAQHFGEIGDSDALLSLYEGTYLLTLHREQKPGIPSMRQDHKKTFRITIRPHQVNSIAPVRWSD